MARTKCKVFMKAAVGVDVCVHERMFDMLFCIWLSSSDPAFEIAILDVFGFEEFQRNGYEQVRKTILFALIIIVCV